MYNFFKQSSFFYIKFNYYGTFIKKADKKQTNSNQNPYITKLYSNKYNYIYT